jgi:hypothetical protein
MKTLLDNETLQSTTEIPSPKSPAEGLGIDDFAPPVDAYYDAERKEYLVQNSGGRWLSLAEGGFKRRLRSMGYKSKPEGAPVSEVESVMLELQDKRDVSFAAPLAGYESGFYEENGVRFLVTESPRLIIPQPGEWPTIRAFLDGLLASAGEPHAVTQSAVFRHWLSRGVQTLYTRRFAPGQALAVAGPIDCGKSFLQNHIITPVLGGRAAKAALYMQGKTPFNGDLFSAEHLMLEDESSDTAISARLALASHLKQICVNELQPCHRKHRTIVNLKPWWRLTISLNDESERLLVLPPLADDVRDKIILLRATKFPFPMPMGTLEERHAFRDTLTREMPYFVHHLLNLRTPPAWHDDRYGVKTWHHPGLVKALDELAPERHLWELVQRWMADADLTRWSGQASALRSLLMESDATRSDARDLLKWPNACGSYLGRLARKEPGHIHPHRTADSRDWIITLNPEQL